MSGRRYRGRLTRARIVACAVLFAPGPFAAAQGEHSTDPRDAGGPAAARRELPDRMQHLPPEERRMLRHHYESLDEAERERFRGWMHEGGFESMRERVRGMSPEQRRRIRQRWHDASPEEREQMRRRLQGMEQRRRFDPLRRLSREEREQVRERLDRLDTEERERLEHGIEQFRALPPEEKENLRAALSDLRERSEPERRRIARNAERWRELSPEEREALRGQLQRLRRMPADERRLLFESLDLPDPAPQR